MTTPRDRRDGDERPPPGPPASPLEVSHIRRSEIHARRTGADRVREARRRGQEMLAALARLQRALLEGHRDLPGLRRLADLAEDVPQAADPGLRQALAEVTLRARVELARHETVRTG